MRTLSRSRLKRRTIVQIDTLRANDIPGRTRISHDVLECPHAQETKHPVPPRLTPWYVVRRRIAVLVVHSTTVAAARTTAVVHMPVGLLTYATSIV